MTAHTTTIYAYDAAPSYVQTECARSGAWKWWYDGTIRLACMYDGVVPHARQSTGKERDSETNLDYFGARYLSSAMGRFTTPDWSETPEPVPYADFSDPQTLNLYGYVRNNPLRFTDPDGHGFWTRLGNWLTGGGWNEDEEAERVRQAAIQRQANEARAALSQMRGLTINGQTPSELAKSGSNQEVISAHRAFVRHQAQVLQDQFWSPCPPGVSCGVMPYAPGGRPLFRGGRTLIARPGIDVKLDAAGMVLPGRGVSVSTDAASRTKFGGARQVTAIPSELQIIQRGANPNHFEIAPRAPMSLERFQELLNQVILK